MTLAEFFKTHPALKKEWDTEANAKEGISPEQATEGSKKRVWWKCEKGHSWQAIIESRTILGRGCPYCANKKVLAGYNDLATTNKDILKFWDYQKNTDISPTEITECSKKRVWWRCEKGHSWQQIVQAITLSETESSGCPYCYGIKIIKGENDLLFLNPEVAKEWCYELNKFGPDEVSEGSKKKVWWKCELGHTWQAPIHTRTGPDKTKCPYCVGRKVWEGFNDLKTTHPRLAYEWAEDLNGDLKPTEVGKGSHKKVWWECGAGHVWQAVVYSRAKDRGTGCPVCAGVVKKPKDYYLDPDTNAIKRLNKSKK